MKTTLDLYFGAIVDRNYSVEPAERAEIEMYVAMGIGRVGARISRGGYHTEQEWYDRIKEGLQIKLPGTRNDAPTKTFLGRLAQNFREYFQRGKK